MENNQLRDSLSKILKEEIKEFEVEENYELGVEELDDTFFEEGNHVFADKEFFSKLDIDSLFNYYAVSVNETEYIVGEKDGTVFLLVLYV